MADDAAAPRCRILYVEDDRIAALLFEEALRAHPVFEVRVAEDGASALALAVQWPPQLIVLDAHLPDTTALALLPRLRALDGMADVPAVVCSADAHEADIRAGLAAGFLAWWPKPVERSRLLAALGPLTRADQP